MKKPKCKLCRSPHWTYEGHSFADGVTKVRDETPNNVTPVTKYVMPILYQEPPLVPPHEHRGRPRKYTTNAERQKAYRERSRE